MHNFNFLHVVLVALLAVSSGCGDSGKSPDSSNPATQSSSNTEGVVKIAVLTDGTVFVNSESVAIDSLASKLDSIGEIKEIWYHREAPDAGEPHENAMKAIAEIANRKLPIAMYLDRDFTQRANFGQ
jgi:biopolymer transport protein ExbD